MLRGVEVRGSGFVARRGTVPGVPRALDFRVRRMCDGRGRIPRHPKNRDDGAWLFEILNGRELTFPLPVDLGFTRGLPFETGRSRINPTSAGEGGSRGAIASVSRVRGQRTKRVRPLTRLAHFVRSAPSPARGEG